MSNKRAGLDLNEIIDIETLKSDNKKNASINQKEIERVAETSGFIKRLPTNNRRRRKKSPYTEQVGIKVRPSMKKIFQDIGDKLSTYDHTTFELAILALLEKENEIDMINQYKKIISNNNKLEQDN